MIRVSSFLLGVAVISACGGSGGVPNYFPVPEDAQNPLVIEYGGASLAETTDIVAKVCSDIPLAVSQVRRDDGYVETRWADIASFNLGSQAQNYPLRERTVIYVFQAQATGDAAGILQISGYYQPTRPTGTSPRRDSRYDRLLPTNHPGYQLALQIEWRLRREFDAKGFRYSGKR